MCVNLLLFNAHSGITSEGLARETRYLRRMQYPGLGTGVGDQVQVRSGARDVDAMSRDVVSSVYHYAYIVYESKPVKNRLLLVDPS